MSHTQKLLSRMSKKATHSIKPEDRKDLRDQYEVIKNDFVKLKEDLQRGYDLAKGMVERKGLINQFLKLK